ncbi:MAG: DUF58 domain-containing protein [Myxococcales bacterium]|nr:DUF58 domain-containing protein [Myxococcales bacterium]
MWLRRVLRPPRSLRPTRAGWLFSGICFAVGFAALNTGNNLLYLLFALLLGFLIFSGVFSEAALRGLDVRRSFPSEVYCQTAAPVALELTNRQRRFPAYAVVVEDLAGRDCHTGDTVGRVFALRIAPGEQVRRIYRMTPQRRGPLHFAGFRASTRFPFGLFSKSLRLDARQEMMVFPEIVRRAAAESGRAGAGDRRATAHHERPPEATLVREFAVGDPLRRVHWPRSLRESKLFVRESEPEYARSLCVRLQTAGREAGAAFERSVRDAASEVVAALSIGQRVSLITDEHRFPDASGAKQRLRLLRFLATVAPRGSGSAPGEASAS